MTVPNRGSIDGLLDQAGWAKALARQLARDADSADELVQRTWIAALEHPQAIDAGAPSTMRRWMASVMRNFVRQDARERERRLRREGEAAKPDRAHDKTLEGIEGQRRLLDALDSLGEPYRRTLYARYFEGLAPRRIAEREATPVKTVKTRLARGLALLRERLDRAHGGDRAAWMAWIVPMAAESGLPTALLGALIVDTKLKSMAALVVVVCLIAAGVQTLRPDTALSGGERALGVAPPPPVEPEVASMETGAQDAREPVSVPDPVALAHAQMHAHHGIVFAAVRGRVLDLDNRPVGGVRIVYESLAELPAFAKRLVSPEDLRSDDSGAFELPPRTQAVNALVEDPRWVTVFKAFVGNESPREATIFVAPRIEFSGTVVDPTRRPVEGAEVELRLDSSIKRNLERRLDGAYLQSFIARTDVDGRFTLAFAPSCAAEISASAPGWLPGTIPAPALSTTELVIALEARDKPSAIVRGIVLSSERQPLAGVNVAVGSLTRVTGSDGRFALDLDSQGHGDIFAKGVDDVWRTKFPRNRLRAVRYGLLPFDLALPPIEELRQDTPPREFTVILEGASLEIQGRVVDSAGQPVPHAKLSVLDETPFGPIYERVGEAAVAMEASIEQLLRGGVNYLISDAGRDGRFRINGLMSRKYTLAALDPKTLAYGVLPDVEAGRNDVQILLPTAQELVRVAGRVVSRSGEGLVGINLEVGRLADGAITPDWVKSLRTDAEGNFDLGKVNPDKLRIQVVGEEIFLIMAWQPPPGARLDELEIAVSRRCSIKVELTPTAPRADEFAFLDAAGMATTNLQFEGPMMSLPERCAIVDGRSEVHATEDTATIMLLFEQGKEVARMPVRLVPGELTILRP